MPWTVERTETFLSALKEHKKNHELLTALEKKIERMRQDPTSLGGKLSGELHGWQSTRLVKNFRLLFKTEESEKKVFLGAIDHRKEAY